MAFPRLLVFTGPQSSGKGVARERAESFGCYGVESGKIIDDLMQEVGIPRLQKGAFADQLRRERGSAFLLQEALRRAGDRPLAIDGLRSPGEIRSAIYHERCGIILWIDADEALRYRWNQESSRPDRLQKSLAQFRAEDQEEFDPGNDELTSRNLRFAFERSNACIRNSGELELFLENVTQVLQDICAGKLSCESHHQMYGYSGAGLPAIPDPVHL